MYPWPENNSQAHRVILLSSVIDPGNRQMTSEKVSEVEEEKATDIVSNWDSPDLALDLVDQIWDIVKGWLTTGSRPPVISSTTAATSVIILGNVRRSGYGCST